MKYLLMGMMLLFFACKCKAQEKKEVNSGACNAQEKKEVNPVKPKVQKKKVVNPVILLDCVIEKLDDDSGYVYHVTIFNNVYLNAYPFIVFSNDTLPVSYVDNPHQIDKDDKLIRAFSKFYTYGERAFSTSSYNVPTKEYIDMDSIHVYLVTSDQTLSAEFPSTFAQSITPTEFNISDSIVTLTTNKKWKEMTLLIFNSHGFAKKIHVKNDVLSNKMRHKISLLNRKDIRFMIQATSHNNIRYFYRSPRTR